MRRYTLVAHPKTDLKVHVVWVPKYRKRVLTGQVSIRVRDVLRQIAIEHELDILTGQVASDHVHMFIAYRPTQDISKIMQWLKRDQLTDHAIGIPALEEAVPGTPLLGWGVSCGRFRLHHGRIGSAIHRGTTRRTDER